MAWTIDLHPAFQSEFLALSQPVKIELAAMIELLEELFYRRLIRQADDRFDEHVAGLKEK